MVTAEYEIYHSPFVKSKSILLRKLTLHFAKTPTTDRNSVLKISQQSEDSYHYLILQVQEMLMTCKKWNLTIIFVSDPQNLWSCCSEGTHKLRRCKVSFCDFAITIITASVGNQIQGLDFYGSESKTYFYGFCRNWCSCHCQPWRSYSRTWFSWPKKSIFKIWQLYISISQKLVFMPSILEMKLPIFSNSIIKCCRNWCWFHHGQLALERRWMLPCPPSTASYNFCSDTSR